MSFNILPKIIDCQALNWRSMGNLSWGFFVLTGILMTITGNLAEYSLPEIFQLLDQGSKSGLLTVRGYFESSKFSSSFVWLHQGRVVAASDRLDYKGLLNIIEQRRWVKDLNFTETCKSCAAEMPLGLHLKSLGILNSEQLKILFTNQVVSQVNAIFKLNQGLFRFDPNTQMPNLEMTGLSLPATEATLMGLRGMTDWTGLSSKLPAPDSALFSTIAGKPHLRLDFEESQVWESTDGNATLKAVAKKLNLSIEKIQQIAFRLIVVGLAEEDPGFSKLTSTPTKAPLPETPSNSVKLPEKSSDSNAAANYLNSYLASSDTSASAASNSNVSNISVEVKAETKAPTKKDAVSSSFLQNLLGFLKNKK
jgi:hypothetical protein